MFTAARLFFSTNLGKGLLIGIGVVLLLVATYSMGHSHGYADGHDKGFASGQASRNNEVDHLKDNVAALTTIINDERKAEAERIKTIESNAANAAVVTEALLNQKIRERDKIIQEYASAVPKEVQASCGLSIETVEAINKLIDIANKDEDEVARPNSTDTGSPPNHVDGDVK